MLFELDQILARAEDWSELRCNPQLEEQTIGSSLDTDSVLEARSTRPYPSKANIPHIESCTDSKTILLSKVSYRKEWNTF